MITGWAERPKSRCFNQIIVDVSAPGMPVVAFAVPYHTGYGRRVFSGAVVAASHPHPNGVSCAPASNGCARPSTTHTSAWP
jgi:hypothetical protein